MKRVIITGANGFVGSYTVRAMTENGIEVLALDLPAVPSRLQPHPLLTYRQVNIADPSALRAAASGKEYDTFVHFAWAGSAGEQRADYALQTQNAVQAVECLKAAKAVGCSRFLCAGSIMEREVEAAAHAQGCRPAMGYVYGVGKYMAHCLCKPVAADIGIDLVWPVITNAYGPGETSPRFVNSTIRKILRGEPLQFTAATQNYDFVHVADVARAFFLIAQHGKPFCEYVVGSGRARPLKSFILEMMSALAPDAAPVFGTIPFTGINLPLSAFDASQTQRDCGFTAEIPFGEGVRQTMEWLKTAEG